MHSLKSLAWQMALYWTRYEKIIFITLACIVLPEKLGYFLYIFQVSLEIESDNWNKVSCFFIDARTPVSYIQLHLRKRKSTARVPRCWNDWQYWDSAVAEHIGTCAKIMNQQFRKWCIVEINEGPRYNRRCEKLWVYAHKLKLSGGTRPLLEPLLI